MTASPAALTGVAIIGMACRFPGAQSVGEFWSNLCRGVESIRFFSEAELREAGVDRARLERPGYVRAAPILAEIDRFDAAFFGYSPREAELMDPQQRLFLEVAWEAFDDAGYHAESAPSVVGVFAGGGGVVTSYLFAHAAHPDLPGQTASLPHLGNDKDFLSTRVSYKLNLTGPSLTVQTACSTSLVAVHLACQSLLSGECDMALGGAATVRIPQVVGYVAEKGNVYSLDGHCRPFDAAGQGTIFGSGVAAILLKRLSDAVADGDHVYAVIKGSAVNNDGGRKVSYTAPSVTGQARAMVEAITLADVPPDTIGYVECHATGTATGDPLEIDALTRAFQGKPGRTGYCAVGSVKGNIGHPEQTAGLASLIKAALAVHHAQLPPTLNFTTPNPAIGFAGSPFYVNSALQSWPPVSHPRRAGINSLGIGGTNAFVVIEQAPASEQALPGNERPAHLLTLSAKSDAALHAYLDRFRELSRAMSERDLADTCYTSNVSRSQLPVRFAGVVATPDELRTALGDAAARSSVPRGEPKPLAFLFSGQGSQYAGMGAALYRAHPAFREALDRCATLLETRLDRPLLDIMFTTPDPAGRLDQTRYTQPALFALEYALAQLWLAWGIVPHAVIGHSIGELTAACVAGMVTLEDALALVAERGRLMQGLPPGAMAAVMASEDTVRDLIAVKKIALSIAAINGPQATVVSGPAAAVRELTRILEARGVRSAALSVSHAFHSALMEPMLDAFSVAARAVSWKPPRIPIISNVTGGVIETPLDARYWRDHVRQTVRFADGLRSLHAMGIRRFLEVGPGSALLAAGRSTLPDADSTWLGSLSRQRPEWRSILEAIQHLYMSGAEIDWSQVHRGATHQRLALPTYPFQRKRYWLDGGILAPAPRLPDAGTTHPLLSVRVASPPGEIAFESSPLTADTALVRDHRIGGVAVLPLTAALEAALVAGAECLGTRAVTVQNVVYQEALVLSEGQSRSVRTIVVAKGPERAEFRIAASVKGGDSPWPTHLTGVVSRSATSAMAARCPRPARAHRRIPCERYYTALDQLGISYGPSFRGIKRLWIGRRQALGEIALPADVSRGSHRLHPAFLDACLHLYPAAIGELPPSARRKERPETTFLPTGVVSFRVQSDGVDEGWAHAVRRDSGSDDDIRVVDIRIYDKHGNPAALVEGLTLRRLAPSELGHATRPGADRFYRVRWEQRERPPVPASPVSDQPWLVFADEGGVGRTLAQRLGKGGRRCLLVSAGTRFARPVPDHWAIDPRRPGDFHRLVSEVAASGSIAGVVYLWGLDAPAVDDLTLDQLDRAELTGCGGVMFAYQALCRARAAGFLPGRLWLVTRNAQDIGTAEAATGLVQAPLWGLGRTIALEAPAVWGGLVDLPPARRGTAGRDASALAAELLSPDGEDQIALREGKRFVARLGWLALDASSPAPRRTSRACTYLVTGGLGMLGQRVARWLVETYGVRSLVLTGRRAANEEARRAVKELEAQGARVHVIAADVSVEADVRRLMGTIRRMPPLKGVIHGAGILEDGILEQMEWTRFTAATAPKIKGAWLLHTYTRDCALDHFVVQSSLLSLTGSAGQANYTAANAFLDALVALRARSGQPALGINWGPWSEAGMAASRGARGAAMWQARGVRLLPPAAGLHAFSRLLASSPGQAAVADIDWPAFLQHLGRPAPLYAGLETRALESPAPSPPGASGSLAQAAPETRRAHVVALVRERITRELGFAEPIDTRQPLNELGLDSLMSVNVANRLEAALGIPVPLVKLIRGPSIEQLVDELFPASAALALDVPRGGDSSRAGARSKTSADGWLVVPRPVSSPRARLFCFPFAGAGATAFRAWAESMPADIELVAVEPPGRAGRIAETPVTSVKMFTDGLFPSLLSHLDRPFAFFGHCLGGVTAFESARRLLEEHGRPPHHLFVSAARPPHLLDREGEFERRLLASLLTHRDFDPLLPVHEQTDSVFAEVIRQFNIGATDEFLSRPELRQALLPAVRADFAMASGYRAMPEALPGLPITCFNGLDDPYVTREDAVAWTEYTRTTFRLHQREGAHFLVVDDKAFILDAISRELASLTGGN